MSVDMFSDIEAEMYFSLLCVVRTLENTLFEVNKKNNTLSLQKYFYSVDNKK